MIPVFHEPGNRRTMGCHAVPSTLLLLVKAQPSVRCKILMTARIWSEFIVAFSTEMSVCCGRNSHFRWSPLLACSGTARFTAVIQLSRFDYCAMDVCYYRLSICMCSLCLSVLCGEWAFAFLCVCFWRAYPQIFALHQKRTQSLLRARPWDALTWACSVSSVKKWGKIRSALWLQSNYAT